MLRVGAALPGGLPELALKAAAPLAQPWGAHQQHGPASSAESQQTGDLACTAHMPAAATGWVPRALLATPGAEPDAASFKRAMRHGLSQLAPAELAELQQELRAQRLARQQESVPQLAPARGGAGAAAPLPRLALPSGDATALLQQVAATVRAALGDPSARPHPLHTGGGARLAAAPPAAAPAPSAAGADRHPGVTAARAARNTPRRARTAGSAAALLRRVAGSTGGARGRRGCEQSDDEQQAPRGSASPPPIGCASPAPAAAEPLSRAGSVLSDTGAGAPCGPAAKRVRFDLPGASDGGCERGSDGEGAPVCPLGRVGAHAEARKRMKGGGRRHGRPQRAPVA
ncbi:hypothetical protein HT031_005818 [Scenedesmus sp. PABB004]|nr:hypothetical protein HT031_005818 [Scenedesmus sp. PABB004]